MIKRSMMSKGPTLIVGIQLTQNRTEGEPPLRVGAESEAAARARERHATWLGAGRRTGWLVGWLACWLSDWLNEWVGGWLSELAAWRTADGSRKIGYEVLLSKTPNWCTGSMRFFKRCLCNLYEVLQHCCLFYVDARDGRNGMLWISNQNNY